MKYEYKFEPYSGDLEKMEVKPTSLRELMDTMALFEGCYNAERKECEKATSKINEHVQNMDFNDFHDKSTKYFELEDLEKEEKIHTETRDTYATALDGIRGAIRYYVAKELNTAFKIVLPKYVGKKAGPKTTEKFFNEVAGQLTVPMLNVYRGSHHTMAVAPQNRWQPLAELFYNEELEDSENRFKESFEVCVPNDEFEGSYPEDWTLWAKHVQSANEYLKQKFNEFMLVQDSLIHALKIGDTAMLTVYSYNQKERR